MLCGLVKKRVMDSCTIVCGIYCINMRFSSEYHTMMLCRRVAVAITSVNSCHGKSLHPRGLKLRQYLHKYAQH